MIPWKRSFLCCLGSSISASEAGRLKRSSRCAARLLRCDSIDSTPKTPNTKPPKTRIGIRSSITMKASVIRCILRKAVSSQLSLHFDVHDLLDDDRSKDLSDEGEDAHLDAQVMRPQGLHIVGLDVEHEGKQAERQSDQHHAGEPALGGQRLDLAEDAVALADNVANLVEDLREVAAGLALDGGAGHGGSQGGVEY